MRLVGNDADVKAYQNEMKKIKDQYAKNLISFVQYEKTRKQLKNKYKVVLI